MYVSIKAKTALDQFRQAKKEDFIQGGSRRERPECSLNSILLKQKGRRDFKSWGREDSGPLFFANWSYPKGK